MIEWFVKEKMVSKVVLLLERWITCFAATLFLLQLWLWCTVSMWLTRSYFYLQIFVQRCSSLWSDSQVIRSTFINYFCDRNHLFVPSSTVLAKKHEGTYFINAGMNQVWSPCLWFCAGWPFASILCICRKIMTVVASESQCGVVHFVPDLFNGSAKAETRGGFPCLESLIIWVSFSVLTLFVEWQKDLFIVLICSPFGDPAEPRASLEMNAS